MKAIIKDNVSEEKLADDIIRKRFQLDDNVWYSYSWGGKECTAKEFLDKISNIPQGV